MSEEKEVLLRVEHLKEYFDISTGFFSTKPFIPKSDCTAFSLLLILTH